MLRHGMPPSAAFLIEVDVQDLGEVSALTVGVRARWGDEHAGNNVIRTVEEMIGAMRIASAKTSPDATCDEAVEIAKITIAALVRDGFLWFVDDRWRWVGDGPSPRRPS